MCALVHITNEHHG